MLPGGLTSGSESADAGHEPCLQSHRIVTRGHPWRPRGEATAWKKKKHSEGSQTERESILPILLGTSGYICKTICKEELDRRSSEDH